MIVGPNGQPQLTQEQAMQIKINDMRLGLYLSLIPVVAASRLQQSLKGDDWDGDRTDCHDKIAEEADVITVAALKRMGINFKPVGT